VGEYVGGKSFNNSNGQYPDFLQKHKITNNTFIIEIKTPKTPLLEKSHIAMAYISHQKSYQVQFYNFLRKKIN
jgi:hypothetical protein